ncbi:Hypothetical protein PHPALM_36577 [Phytophthora palmivora]|uniref:Uncharacterized protein n=1 Tax=Phytophthora palmivora TaxID=4796 RepID=A0A2P4WZL4_9STRA|nr:Hypothetical protein PHPALM_36577 [Phytophthora palmivora]
MRRPVYRVKVVQSEGFLNMMTKLLYRRTEGHYNTDYDALQLYCRTNKTKLSSPTSRKTVIRVVKCGLTFFVGSILLRKYEDKQDRVH